jgi:hypothetical protein
MTTANNNQKQNQKRAMTQNSSLFSPMTTVSLPSVFAMDFQKQTNGT